MKALLRAVAMVLAFTSLALAATESLADLKSKADLAHGGDQARTLR